MPKVDRRGAGTFDPTSMFVNWFQAPADGWYIINLSGISAAFLDVYVRSNNQMIDFKHRFNMKDVVPLFKTTGDVLTPVTETYSGFAEGSTARTNLYIPIWLDKDDYCWWSNTVVSTSTYSYLGEVMRLPMMQMWTY